VAARLVRFLGKRGGLLETDERQDAEDRGGDDPGEARYLGLLANWVPKTDRVLWLPALTISVTASARITSTSNAPSTKPARVDARIPR